MAVKDAFVRNMEVQEEVKPRLTQSAVVAAVPLREGALETKQYSKGTRQENRRLSGSLQVHFSLIMVAVKENKVPSPPAATKPKQVTIFLMVD